MAPWCSLDDKWPWSSLPPLPHSHPQQRGSREVEKHFTLNTAGLFIWWMQWLKYTVLDNLWVFLTVSYLFVLCTYLHAHLSILKSIIKPPFISLYCKVYIYSMHSIFIDMWWQQFYIWNAIIRIEQASDLPPYLCSFSSSLADFPQWISSVCETESQKNGVVLLFRL